MVKLIKAVILALLLMTSLSVDARTMRVTAYTHTGSTMANGQYPYEGAVASDSFPLGTQLLINGNYYTVLDRVGNGGGSVDIFMDSHYDAVQFGVKYLEVIEL